MYSTVKAGLLSGVKYSPKLLITVVKTLEIKNTSIDVIKSASIIVKVVFRQLDNVIYSIYLNTLEVLQSWSNIPQGKACLHR